MIESAPGIFLFPAAMRHDCADAVRLLAKAEWVEAAPGKHVYDIAGDNDHPIWVCIKDNFLVGVNQMLDEFRKHDTDNKIPMLDESHIFALRCMRYERGAGFPSHFDARAQDDRVITGILYLNDDYEGGELTYPYHDLTHVPEAGDMIFHPAVYTHPHEAAPVLRGVKYICVFWCSLSPVPEGAGLY